MYNSLHEWASQEFKYKSFESFSERGSSIYSEVKTFKGYFVSSMETVIDIEGVERASRSKIYTDGTCPIKEKDSIQIDGKFIRILSIETFYDRGNPSLKVIHL